uniref:Uncharacterized protein n=1 Tax=Ciona savignyi TaxID=51511 RepID=H2Y6T0_CIOSA
PLVIVSDGEDSVSTGVGADSDVLGTNVVTPSETKSEKLGKLTNCEDEFIKIEKSVKIKQNVVEKSSVSNVVRTEKSSDELKQTNDSEITHESIEQIAKAEQRREVVSESIQSDTENESKPGIECLDGGISLVEWGLVPRRASCKAKERIQKQLCGPDLTGSGIISSRGTQRKSNRQMSLRSNSVPPTITSKDGEPSNPSCNTSPQHSSGDDEDSGSELPCVKWLVGGVE